MFKKKMVTTTLVLLPFLGLWAYKIVVPHQGDRETYLQMVQEKKQASSPSLSPISQVRKQVTKDIWFAQSDTSRLHYQIASKGSTLTLTPVQNKFVVLETLETIKCWMQDKLLQETQQARLIEAKTGSYNYHSQEFIAHDVFLSLFRIPGHTLPQVPLDKEEAFLKGLAQEVCFVLSGKTPKFQAHQFQAIMVKE